MPRWPLFKKKKPEGLTYKDIPLSGQRELGPDESSSLLQRPLRPRRPAYKNGRQICLLDGQRIAGALAYSLSPDGTAFLGEVRFSWGYKTSEREVELIRIASGEIFRKGARLIEGFARSRREARLLRSSGFNMFANLILMQRGPRKGDSKKSEEGILRWECYSKRNEAEFTEVFERTQRGSLDCPRLPRVIEADKSILAQKMLGGFDPALWLLARKGPEAVGLLLLSRQEDPFINLTYLGVVPEQRGKGYGGMLLERAIYMVCGLEGKTLSLAVDEENRFALRLYREGGFKVTGRIGGYYLVKGQEQKRGIAP